MCAQNCALTIHVVTDELEVRAEFDGFSAVSGADDRTPVPYCIGSPRRQLAAVTHPSST